MAANPNLMGRIDKVDMERMLMAGFDLCTPESSAAADNKRGSQMLRGRVVPDLPARKPVVMIQSVRSMEMVGRIYHLWVGGC